MNFESRRVKLADIDIADCHYRISTADADPLLKKSIRDIGLLHLPIIRRREGRYQIVSGFQRIRILDEEGRGAIPVLLLPEPHTAIEAVRVAILEKAYRRDLNVVELARAYGLLLSAAGDLESVSKEAEHLHIPFHTDHIQKVLRIGSLTDSLQRCLENGTVSLTIALKLAKMPPQDIDAFLMVYARYRPGLNRQKEIVSLVWDTAMRDKTTCREVLQNALPKRTSDGGEISLPQECKRFVDRLRQRRYPTVAETQKRFQQAVDQIKPGKGIHVEAPRHFESNHYRIHLTFSSPKELRQRGSDLNRLVDHPDLHRLFQ